MGCPATLSSFFGGALATLIALPAVPHVALRLGLGLLLVELRGWGGVQGLVSCKWMGVRCPPETAEPHHTIRQFPLKTASAPRIPDLGALGCCKAEHALAVL